MYVVIEEWTPKPAFLKASPETRTAFFETLTAGTAAMAGHGITTLGWGRVDPDGDHSSPHQWFAVWQLANSATADHLLSAVQASGWYDYFDQTNLRGELRPVSDVVAEHLVLR